MPIRLLVLSFTIVAVGACSRTADVGTASPGQAASGSGEGDGVEASSEPGPGVDENEFVSNRDEEIADDYHKPEFEDDFASDYEGDYAVTSPDAARELAEAAVAEQLNPKQTWKTSPVFPSTWPSKEKSVDFFFFPMVASPHSMDHFQLMSAAYRVRVSLEDGSTKVMPIKKKRKLGVVKDRRTPMTERQELELAERALVHTVLGGDASSGENNFWGYLKFFHENPKFAKDIKARSPKFYRWLEAYKK